MTQRREEFLKTFLTALGAKNIEWSKSENDKLFGTVIYDIQDTDERQDFVWHMTEDKVPSDEVKKLLEYFIDNNLLDIDKINKPINELNLDFIDQSKREKVIKELFDIEVRMIDDGEETDKYFIHD